MRKLFIIPAIVLSLALAACHPLDGNSNGDDNITNQQKRDWFGNSTAEPIIERGVCVSRLNVPAPPPYNPDTFTRPSTVGPQEPWQVVGFQVRVFTRNEKNIGYDDMCVPVAVHIFARFDPRSQAIVCRGNSVLGTCPFDAIVNSPWTGAYMSFAYDPQTIGSGEPPYYDITLRATYLRERDFGSMPSALTCAMTIAGATITRSSTVTLSPIKGGYVECRIHLNRFNPPST